MRSVWQILGIDPTDDARLIKRAYAAQIKKYRPDEHPQEFQEVHDAYQRAQALVTRAPTSIEPPDTDQASAEASSSAPDDTQLQQEDTKAEEADEELQRKRALYEQNVELIRQLLSGPAEEIQKVRAWAFLTESDFIYDGEYNFYLGVATLKLLHSYLSESPSDALQNQWELPPPKTISPPIWQFLAAVFNWAMRGNYLQSHLEPNELRLLVKAGILDDVYLPKPEKISLPSQKNESRTTSRDYRNLGCVYIFVTVFIFLSITRAIIELAKDEASKHHKPPPNETKAEQLPVTQLIANQRPLFRIEVDGDFVQGEIDIKEEDYVQLIGEGIGLEFTIDRTFAVSEVTVYAGTGNKSVDYQIKGVAKYWAINARALGPIINSITKRIFIPIKNKGKKI